MMRLPAAAGLALALLLPLPVGAAPLDVEKTVGGVIEQAVIPAYRDLNAASRMLEVRMGSLCASPSEAGLDAARTAFAGMVLAWSRAEIVRFGPITAENRLERFLFWPDRKGTGLRQVQAALSTQDGSVGAAGALAGKSVAMQGLGALEFILYGSGSDALAKGNAHRCAYGGAAAANLATMASATLADWTAPNGYASEWRHPGPDGTPYRDADEAIAEAFDTVLHGLELVRDVRLDGFLADAAAEDRPRQAIYWRSGLTVASLAANIASLHAFFDAAHFGDALPEDQKWLTGSIDFEFANLEGALRAADAPVETLLATPETRAKLAYARIVSSSLTDLVGRQLAGALQISSGFSSLDGD